MSKIYQISEKIHEKTKWNRNHIFLSLNTVVWSLIGLCLAIASYYICSVSTQGQEIIIFCIAAYTGLIVGFFGGALYIYRHE